MAEATVIDLPSGPFVANPMVPGDKSLGHRALILSAIAEGRSSVRGLSDGADIGSTIDVLGALGVRIDGPVIESPGFMGWVEPSAPLDCGNSGTTMRLMAGTLTATPFRSTLVGDESLTRRPMRRLVAPLGALGARVSLSGDGTAPITIDGTLLRGADVVVPIPSAQVRTAVALAALHADGRTTIDSPAGFRDHTEHWLVSLGRAERVGPTKLVVEPGPIAPFDITVPGDPSSAAFLWAAAAVRPGSSVTTSGVSLNPGRLGFVRILERMGARVQTTVTGQVLGDPIGDVTVAHAPLRATTVTGAEVAATVDELPLLAVVAAAADGVTTVRDAAELRAKESDRLEGAVALARLAGARARIDGDGFVVGDGPAADTDTIDARGDHRLAMAGAVAGVVSREPVVIAGFEACAVSWPGFRRVLESLWS